MADDKHRHENTFQKGMHKGPDKAQTSNQTYTDALNGRVIYNENGTYAFENAKGTKQVLTIQVNHANPNIPYPPIPGGATPPYIIIGQFTINGQCVVLLTNDWWSEIGVISQPQFGVLKYSTIYNDYNDPAGPITTGPNVGQGRLQLKKAYNAKMTGILENQHTTRVYWDDDYNEPRTLNITPPTGTVWTIPYPIWHSAHSIASMPDLTWGLIKYRKNITGSLVAGKRQYAYRYISQSGYTSPWSALCSHVMMTAVDVSSIDWNTYFMTDAGSPTAKGHEFEIKYLDTRFQQIEVACLYWAIDIAPQGANIVFKADIPSNGSVIFQHISDIGVVVTVEELNQRYFAIKNAKTDAISGDNFLHKGNIEVYDEPQIDTTPITAEPILKKILSDEFGNGHDTTGINEYLPTTIPLTNQVPKVDTTTLNLFTGASGSLVEQYMVEGINGQGDYCNYKGTQIEHLYKSRFRDDTYPFALVIWDKKGQPSFAQHITDLKFPTQYGNTYTDTRLSGVTTATKGAVGDYFLTSNIPNSTDLILDNTVQGNNICPIIQGVKFGGIDLTDVLFDQNGELQISGFSIVSTGRVGAIIAQGLLLNGIADIDGNGNDTHTTRPLATAWNWNELTPSQGSTNPQIGKNEVFQQFYVRGNAFTFEAPDGFINPDIFGVNIQGENIELIGAVAPVNLQFGSYAYPDRMQFMAGYATVPNVPFTMPCSPHQVIATNANFWPHYYNKHYICVANDELDSNPDRPTGTYDANNGHFGDSKNLTKIFVGARNVLSYFGNDNYNEYSGMTEYYPVAGQFNYAQFCQKSYTARAHENTILLVSDNLRTASLRHQNPLNTNEYCNIPYYLINYKRSVANVQISQPLLDNRVYNNIGHFIPINDSTVAMALDSNTGKYIFNDIEVFYGDTYVDFFVYDRLEPVYFTLPGTTDPSPLCAQWYAMQEYAIGTGFCVETTYNHTMRSGVIYPRYGSQPEATYCGSGTGENKGGIFYFNETIKQNEDFNVSAVLNAASTANQYNSLQACFGEINTDFALMEIYSNQKVYGECYDSFRQFKTTNFQFAQGQYGEITEMAYMGGYNSIYMLQKYAFARILFNERAEIAASGGSIITATAGGYQGHNYISIKDGCQHQWSVVNTGKALYWTDAESGNLNRFSQNGVESYSDVHDYHDSITTWTADYWELVDPGNVLSPNKVRYYDNPTYLGGIHSVFDYNNESIYTTFTPRLQSNQEGVISSVGTPQTIEYNQKLDQFQARHSFYPTIYLNIKQSFFAPALTPSSIHTPIIHQMDEGIIGQIFGTNFPSTLEFTTNPSVMGSKVYDVGRVLVDTQTGANRISLVNLTTTIVATQNVTLNNAILDSRPTYREGYLTYPMMQLSGRQDRMRGAYLIQKYTIDNDGSNTVVRITGVETVYRFSDKL